MKNMMEEMVEHLMREQAKTLDASVLRHLPAWGKWVAQRAWPWRMKMLLLRIAGWSVGLELVHKPGGITEVWCRGEIVDVVAGWEYTVH